MKCLACGSTNLIEGKVSDEAERFIPKDKVTFWSYFGTGSREILNFACVHCGNLQFVVDFKDEDKNNYIKFEGEQPNLLERLDSEKQD